MNLCVEGDGGMTRYLCVAEWEGLCILDVLGKGVMLSFWILRKFNEMILLNTK